ncbi:activator-dependent family glycosyltransferase [Prauserella cavernicola]|uniref:Activator-dependent family glycosyltransferase n=1 Tax=Prauserella cavernicola TaxID=2800127 RepID=A0A934QZ61_9PSEU|nr:activator-dependent family glycosyltransferase [Prauserella cavernicola]MBK1787979.1 activator-dependent family glycosyltransferase [Prauserella cavernicola]
MRVLFVPYPARTHLYHQVPLAWALRIAGHEVRFAVQPDLVHDVMAAGLPALTVGEEMRWGEVLDNLPSEDPGRTGLDLSDYRPGENSFEFLHTRFTVMATFPFHELCVRPVVDDLVHAARAWQPDLVVWDETMFAAPIAARACGAAHARLLTGLDLLGAMRSDYLRLLVRRHPSARQDPVREWLGWNLARFGCDFDEDVVVGQFTLNPYPASLQYPLPNQVSFRYVPYHGGSEAVPEFDPPASGARVCLTFGLSFRDATEFEAEGVTDLLDAVGGVDAEVVATVQTHRLVAGYRIPGNVRVVDFVPLEAVLPTCSAIVHHGGAGTGLSASLHAVPQLLVPDGSWDTVPRAVRLDRLGAGVHVERNGFRPAMLRDRLTDVLGDASYRESARSLCAEMEGVMGLPELVPVLAELAAKFGAGKAGAR